MSMEVTGPFSKGVPCDERNLAWQAADLAGWQGHIALEKNLPHGAGIGGGSSDAGAVLRALKSDADPLALGADVPVCLSTDAQRMRGVGELLSPVGSLPKMGILLINPGKALPTPDVFRALSSKTNPPMPQDIPTGATATDFCDWLKMCRNDLLDPARALCPEIGAVLQELRSSGPLFYGMSGSGTTCFGLFPPGATQLAQVSDSLRARNAGWWVAAGDML